MLFQSLRIPLAPGHPEEVPTIYMQCTRERTERVCDGMDGVLAEKNRVGRFQVFSAGGFQPLRRATVENVVLSAAVQSDGCPHAVVVGVKVHAWRPDDVQDRQLG